MEQVDAGIYKYVEGVHVVKLFSDDAIRSVLSYKPRNGDVFSASYPKCGVNWIQHILYKIYTDAKHPEGRLDFRFRMPFLELQGADTAIHGIKPGALKTHLPFQKVPYSKHAKYIYMARNPYDCCVSFYYHTRNLPPYGFQDGTFDQFFDMFLEGKVDFGDYFDHLLSWYEHRNDANILFLTFEGLQEDLRGGILKIARFLGEAHAEKLSKNHDLLEKIVRSCDLESMTNAINARAKVLNEEEITPDDLKGLHPSLLKGLDGTKKITKKPATGEFLHMSPMGGWQDHFSTEQLERMKEWIRRRVGEKDVMNLWCDLRLP